MHPNNNPFKIKPLKPPKMVKIPTSCTQAVGKVKQNSLTFEHL